MLTYEDLMNEIEHTQAAADRLRVPYGCNSDADYIKYVLKSSDTLKHVVKYLEDNLLKGNL